MSPAGAIQQLQGNHPDVGVLSPLPESLLKTGGTCQKGVGPFWLYHRSGVRLAVGQNQWYHFGVGAPPILEYLF